MERTNDGIKIWFWSRYDGRVPQSIRDGWGWINTDEFGTPTAFFPGWQCNIPEYFGWHNIIINITLCASTFPLYSASDADIRTGGDWAGSAFSAAGCPGDCWCK